MKKTKSIMKLMLTVMMLCMMIGMTAGATTYGDGDKVTFGALDEPDIITANTIINRGTGEKGYAPFINFKIKSNEKDKTWTIIKKVDMGNSYDRTKENTTLKDVFDVADGYYRVVFKQCDNGDLALGFCPDTICEHIFPDSLCSSSGNTITAKCSNTNCFIKGGITANLTLEAFDAVYDGEKHGAEFSFDTKGFWTEDMGLVLPEIKYYKDGIEIEKEPVEPGSYTAKATFKGQTASADFEIACKEHEWNEGEITKKADCVENGIKTYTCKACGKTKTEDIPATGHTFATEYSKDATYHWFAAVCGHKDVVKDKAAHDWSKGDICICGEKKPEEPVEPEKPEKPVEVKDIISLNSKFEITKTCKKLTVAWGAVEGAESYNVYIQYSGKVFPTEPAMTAPAGKTKASFTTIDGKKLNQKKVFKAYVGVVKGGKEIFKSNIGYVVGKKNTKYTNVKKLKLSKNNFNLSVGKTQKIKAKAILENKNKKVYNKDQAKKFRYASTDEKIATVSSAGKITAVGAGQCQIYIYLPNGKAKAVNVVVK